jgi:hypothetical protein
MVFNFLTTGRMVFANNDFNIFPNPANSTQSISYTLDQESDVSIILFDILGNVVSRLSFADQSI